MFLSYDRIPSHARKRLQDVSLCSKVLCIISAQAAQNWAEQN